MRVLTVERASVSFPRALNLRNKHGEPGAVVLRPREKGLATKTRLNVLGGLWIDFELTSVSYAPSGCGSRKTDVAAAAPAACPHEPGTRHHAAESAAGELTHRLTPGTRRPLIALRAAHVAEYTRGGRS